MSRTAVVRVLAEFPYATVARALLAKTEVNSNEWQWLAKELKRCPLTERHCRPRARSGVLPRPLPSLILRV